MPKKNRHTKKGASILPPKKRSLLQRVKRRWEKMMKAWENFKMPPPQSVI